MAYATEVIQEKLNLKDKSIAANKFKGKGWRVVHDGQKVLNFFFCDGGITVTKHNLFGGTKDSCLKQIKSLGLQFNPEDFEEDMML